MAPIQDPTLLWLVKAGFFIAKVAFSVHSVLLEDCTMTLNVILERAEPAVRCGGLEREA